MNIMVVAPHTDRNGVTTVASLLGSEIASRGKTVCLTHLNNKRQDIRQMYDLDKRPKDRTTEPSKLVKLIKTQVLKASEIPNYCQSLSKNFDAYTVNDRNYTSEDASYLVNFILGSFPYDFVIFDTDTNDMDDLSVRAVIQRCDLVVFVVSQSIVEMKDFKETGKQLTKLYSKPSIVVVNRFDREISTVKDVQDEVGAKRLSKEACWLKLRYNPQVVKYSNSGYMHSLFTTGKSGEYTLLDIMYDTKAIANRVMKFYQKYKTQLSKVKGEMRTEQYKEYLEGYTETDNKAQEETVGGEPS